MGKKSKSIRFDDRTWMLLEELSGRTGTSISSIVRFMVNRNIDELLDKAGNWKPNENKKKEKRSGQPNL